MKRVAPGGGRFTKNAKARVAARAAAARTSAT